MGGEPSISHNAFQLPPSRWPIGTRNLATARPGESGTDISRFNRLGSLRVRCLFTKKRCTNYHIVFSRPSIKTTIIRGALFANEGHSEPRLRQVCDSFHPLPLCSEVTVRGYFRMFCVRGRRWKQSHPQNRRFDQIRFLACR